MSGYWRETEAEAGLVVFIEHLLGATLAETLAGSTRQWGWGPGRRPHRKARLQGPMRWGEAPLGAVALWGGTSIAQCEGPG